MKEIRYDQFNGYDNTPFYIQKVKYPKCIDVYMTRKISKDRFQFAVFPLLRFGTFAYVNLESSFIYVSTMAILFAVNDDYKERLDG